MCAQKGQFQHVVFLIDNQSTFNQSIDLKFDWCLDFYIRKALVKFCRSPYSSF